MRLIFHTLLLGNLGLLGYLILREPPSDAHPPRPEAVSQAPTILLLSERKSADSGSGVAEALENPVMVEGELAASEACQGLGPFADLLMAQKAAERLNAAGLDATLKAVDTPVGEFDFRVILPPLPSLQEAFRRWRELKSREIDSFVITRGKDARGVSLGVFSTEAASLNHQAFLAEMGYETVIKPIPRLSRAYWIQAASGNLSEESLAPLAEDFPGVSLAATACTQHIFSTKGNPPGFAGEAPEV